jgi:hypothetical protein
MDGHFSHECKASDAGRAVSRGYRSRRWIALAQGVGDLQGVGKPGRCFTSVTGAKRRTNKPASDTDALQFSLR